MPIFTFIPSYSTSGDFQFAATTIQFGDGYQQRTTAGINSQKLIFNVAFTNRTPDEIRAIHAFLSALNGVLSFEWNPPPPYNWASSPTFASGTSYTIGQTVKSHVTGSVYDIYTAMGSVEGGGGNLLTNTTKWRHIGRVPLRFICQKGNWQSTDYNRTGLTAVFEQVFE